MLLSERCRPILLHKHPGIDPNHFATPRVEFFRNHTHQSTVAAAVHHCVFCGIHRTSNFQQISRQLTLHAIIYRKSRSAEDSNVMFSTHYMEDVKKMRGVPTRVKFNKTA